MKRRSWALRLTHEVVTTTNKEGVMRITLRRVACLVALAAGPLVACDAAKSTTPGIEPAAGPARLDIGVLTPGGDTLRSCPEMRIPEHPCLGGDLPRR
jgi:hypothetical protein